MSSTRQEASIPEFVGRSVRGITDGDLCSSWTWPQRCQDDKERLWNGGLSMIPSKWPLFLVVLVLILFWLSSKTALLWLQKRAGASFSLLLTCDQSFSTSSLLTLGLNDSLWPRGCHGHDRRVGSSVLQVLGQRDETLYSWDAIAAPQLWQ